MNEIEKLMLQAIQEKRPLKIKEMCDNIWNMPFFFNIDKAKVLTISYNPSIKGIARLYPQTLQTYQKQGLTAEEIFDFQYTYYDVNWRWRYNLLFGNLGIVESEIAHMDVSIFPYRSLNDFFAYKNYDKTDNYLLSMISLLQNQINCILIDGSKNKEIVEKYFKDDYTFVKSKKIPKNDGKSLHELSIYKHKTKDIKLIYFAAQLFGATAVSKNCVGVIAEYINGEF